MSYTILLERLRMESELVARAVKNSTASGKSNGKQVALLCEELPAHARQVQEFLWETIWAGPSEDFQEAGETFRQLLDEMIDTLGKLTALSNGSLAGVQADLEKLRREHVERWPWFSQQDVDQARAEDARGETVDMDDAFAGIAGVSREEWQRRVEARKQCQGKE
jgi:hypothetical protein